MFFSKFYNKQVLNPILKILKHFYHSNHDTRLEHGEITVSRLGTLGLVWAQKGTNWHVWEDLGIILRSAINWLECPYCASSLPVEWEFPASSPTSSLPVACHFPASWQAVRRQYAAFNLPGEGEW